MLVISRRETQKVSFPGLGILVEVKSIKGKVVRLGIDAPKEIRVLRDELNELTELNEHALAAPTAATQQARSCGCQGFVEPPLSEANARKSDFRQIQKCLDAANLAIHLAQNQLRQQLNNNAEIALENALECLDQLEQAVASNATEVGRHHPAGAGSNSNRRLPEVSSGASLVEYGTSTDPEMGTELGVVRESEAGYRTSSSVKQRVSKDLPARGQIVLVGADVESYRRFAARASLHGFATIALATETELVQWIVMHEQPAAILIPAQIDPAKCSMVLPQVVAVGRDRSGVGVVRPSELAADVQSEGTSAADGPTSFSGLRIAGVESLVSKPAVEIDGVHFERWNCDSTSVELESCLSG